MGRSVLGEALHLPFVILDQLFAMSKGFVFSAFELVFLGIALLGNPARSTYVARQTRADMFRILPTNSSSNCLGKGAICTGESLDVCGRNCCFCRCNGSRPTYLVHEERCVSEEELLAILKRQADQQGCSYRAVVGASASVAPGCNHKVLVAVETEGVRNYSMKICPWKLTDSELVHTFATVNINNCTIVPSESFYLFNGTWFHMWAPAAADNQSVFKVYLEGKKTGGAKILLEWLKDLPAVYAGLIFSLKLRCYKSDQVIDSCLFSKNSGVFNVSDPTFLPPTTLHSSTASTTEATAPPVFLTEPSKNVSVWTSNQGKEESELNLLVLVLSVVGALLLFILLSFLLLIIRRRRRGDIDKFKPRENPVYQKGPSVSLKVTEVGDEQDEHGSPPFVIHAESRGQQNGVSGSNRKFKQQGSSGQGTRDPKAPPSQDPEVYQSLIEESVVGGDYQELLDDGQGGNTVLDDNGHEYHVLESDGAGSDSDDSSYSVEMPPVVHAQDKTTADTRSVDDAAGYDEPEAIISDGERELPTTSWARERHSSLCDAHDYAEPDA